MQSSTLVLLLLVSVLVGGTRAGLLGCITGELCPTVPCPAEKFCVAAGFMRTCHKPAGKGQKCSPESDKNNDGSYKGSPPCADGLTCPNKEAPTCM